ncbi:MAG: hypothetical protein AAF957_23630 [Planctomycetota bacterium]
MPPRSAPLLLAALLAAGCATRSAAPPRPVELDREPGSANVPLTVHPAYTASFEAIRLALEVNDLAVARGALRQLRARLAADRVNAPTLAQARERDDDIALRTLAGELPSRESVDAAVKMADGFEKIVEGRLRLEAVQLRIDVVRSETEEQQADVVLYGRSDWNGDLRIQPSAASLVVERTSLEPRTGQERRASTTVGLDEAPILQIPAHGEARVVIGSLPIEVPVGSIATRMRVDVRCNGGTISEDDEDYPARDIAVRYGERTDIPGWIPSTVVAPVELVELVERGNTPLALMLECAVRIAPGRRDEALDRVGVAIQTLPMQSMRTLVPAVRWLAGTDQFGRDERAWRTWLIERVEERKREGRAIGV